MPPCHPGCINQRPLPRRHVAKAAANRSPATRHVDNHHSRLQSHSMIRAQPRPDNQRSGNGGLQKSRHHELISERDSTPPPCRPGPWCRPPAFGPAQTVRKNGDIVTERQIEEIEKALAEEADVQTMHSNERRNTAAQNKSTSTRLRVRYEEETIKETSTPRRTQRLQF